MTAPRVPSEHGSTQATTARGRRRALARKAQEDANARRRDTCRAAVRVARRRRRDEREDRRGLIGLRHLGSNTYPFNWPALDQASLRWRHARNLIGYVALHVVWGRAGLIGSDVDFAKRLRCHPRTVAESRREAQRLGWIETYRGLRPGKHKLGVHRYRLTERSKRSLVAWLADRTMRQERARTAANERDRLERDSVSVSHSQHTNAEKRRGLAPGQFPDGKEEVIPPPGVRTAPQTMRRALTPQEFALCEDPDKFEEWREGEIAKTERDLANLRRERAAKRGRARERSATDEEEARCTTLEEMDALWARRLAALPAGFARGRS